ncbi:hypothetical protein Tco_0570162 [Tanacetum coccineum]
MLDKSMYNSWQIRMLLYIKGKKNGRMMLESIENRPLVYPTIEEDGKIRKKKYAELTEQEKLQDDCDVQATKIILQGLPSDVYSLVNHCKAAKDIWDRVKLLMQGTELSYQERESLYEYYLRFSQLINDMHTIGMTMQQVQVNTKIYECSSTRMEQVCDDPIACLNKAMTFMSTVMASRFPSTNNQLRTSSNPRNQATIQDGRVTVQQVQGRQGQSFAGNMARQCTQPKRPKNYAWFKEKMLLVQAQESGQELDEEQLAFLADPEVADGQATQTTISQNVAFQTDDLDAYESDCDDISHPQNQTATDR